MRISLKVLPLRKETLTFCLALVRKRAIHRSAKADLCASFQRAVVEVLARDDSRALALARDRCGLGGGFNPLPVFANQVL